MCRSVSWTWVDISPECCAPVRTKVFLKWNTVLNKILHPSLCTEVRRASPVESSWRRRFGLDGFTSRPQILVVADS